MARARSAAHTQFREVVKHLAADILRPADQLDSVPPGTWRSARIIFRLHRASRPYCKEHNTLLDRIRAACACRLLRSAGYGPLRTWLASLLLTI